MRNVELHLMDSNGDVALGVQAGLLNEADTSDAECAACSEEVGHIAGTYYPFAVALDHRSQWLVCKDCASNVLETSPFEANPTSDEAFNLFISDAND